VAATAWSGIERRPTRTARASLSNILATNHLDPDRDEGPRLFARLPIYTERAPTGTTSISEVVPEVVLGCWDQAMSTRGERCRYCRESSTHSTRP
jgi:hypothetical protein